jgi:hypothetical protein
MDEIEQLLEGGKAEAAALKATSAQSPSNGHRDVSSDDVSGYAAILVICLAMLISFTNLTFSLAGQVGA